jgi:hypothetical protein
MASSRPTPPGWTVPRWSPRPPSVRREWGSLSSGRRSDFDPRRVHGAPGLIAWRARSRWAVHLGLLFSGVAAIGTLQLLHVRIAYHSVVGLVFVGLVVVHLVQRRRTVARMATQLVRARTFVERRTRLAVSDFLLLFITANVLVSGIVDWSSGEQTELPLPVPFDRWHLDSGLVLVIYIAVHVRRRRRRFRRSTIR